MHSRFATPGRSFSMSRDGFELLLPRPGRMIRGDGVDAAVVESLPERFDVGGFPERRLSDVERAVGTGELLVGEVEIERPGLDGNGNAALARAARRPRGPPARRGGRCRWARPSASAIAARALDRSRFRSNRTAIGEVRERGFAFGFQPANGFREKRRVLAVKHRPHSQASGVADQVHVGGFVLIEARADHEDLETGAAGIGEALELALLPSRRNARDRMQEYVRKSLSSARGFPPAPRHRGDLRPLSARSCSPSVVMPPASAARVSALEIVGPGRGEVSMGVDSAREHQETSGVDDLSAGASRPGPTSATVSPRTRTSASRCPSAVTTRPSSTRERLFLAAKSGARCRERPSHRETRRLSIGRVISLRHALLLCSLAVFRRRLRSKRADLEELARKALATIEGEIVLEGTLERSRGAPRPLGHPSYLCEERRGPFLRAGIRGGPGSVCGRWRSGGDGARAGWRSSSEKRASRTIGW